MDIESRRKYLTGPPVKNPDSFPPFDTTQK
jgi:hypothetical protein